MPRPSRPALHAVQAMGWEQVTPSARGASGYDISLIFGGGRYI